MELRADREEAGLGSKADRLCGGQGGHRRRGDAGRFQRGLKAERS